MSENNGEFVNPRLLPDGTSSGRPPDSSSGLGSLAMGLVVDSDTMVTEDKGWKLDTSIEVVSSSQEQKHASVNGQDENLEYEGIHHIFYNCGVYGHLHESCGSIVDNGTTTKELSYAPENENVTKVTTNEERGLFGPWMTVENCRRRSHNGIMSLSKGHGKQEKNVGNHFTPLENEQVEPMEEQGHDSATNLATLDLVSNRGLITPIVVKSAGILATNRCTLEPMIGGRQVDRVATLQNEEVGRLGNSDTSRRQEVSIFTSTVLVEISSVEHFTIGAPMEIIESEDAPSATVVVENVICPGGTVLPLTLSMSAIAVDGGLKEELEKTKDKVETSAINFLRRLNEIKESHKNEIIVLNATHKFEVAEKESFVAKYRDIATNTYLELRILTSPGDQNDREDASSDNNELARRMEMIPLYTLLKSGKRSLFICSFTLEVAMMELIPLCTLLKSWGRSLFICSLTLETVMMELIPLCTLLKSGGRSLFICSLTLEVTMMELIPLCTLLKSRKCSLFICSLTLETKMMKLIPLFTLLKSDGRSLFICSPTLESGMMELIHMISILQTLFPLDSKRCSYTSKFLRCLASQVLGISFPSSYTNL
ncbi:hypothetical protein V6N12_060943 [Hibiscus sabdariffa]|uniref:Uncharacterized protein n=1 Tax=Hibiscus sabdariffa TaxID=183260 RepID=A0ABR2DWT8_9ROSI